MESSMKRRGLAVLAAFFLVLSAAPAAYAAGTTAGTVVSNSATVNYSVGTVAQTAIGSSEAGNSTGAGTPTTFTVDRKVDVLVSEVGDSFTMTSPGATDQVLTFTVENEGNAVEDFLLTAVDGAGNVVTLGGSAITDNFNATAATPPAIYIDDGATPGVWDPTDTEVAYLDNLAVDTPTTVFIVRNIAAGQVDGDASHIALNAQAVATTGTPAAPGAPLVADTGANVQNDVAGSEQIVFADSVGAVDDQTNPDGQHSAYDGYLIESAQLSISKSMSVISDPFGAVAPNAKAIPGAIVE